MILNDGIRKKEMARKELESIHFEIIGGAIETIEYVKADIDKNNKVNIVNLASVSILYNKKMEIESGMII